MLSADSEDPLLIDLIDVVELDLCRSFFGTDFEAGDVGEYDDGSFKGVKVPVEVTQTVETPAESGDDRSVVPDHVDVC